MVLIGVCRGIDMPCIGDAGARVSRMPMLLSTGCCVYHERIADQRAAVVQATSPELWEERVVQLLHHNMSHMVYGRILSGSVWYEYADAHLHPVSHGHSAWRVWKVGVVGKTSLTPPLPGGPTCMCGVASLLECSGRKLAP
jgi:hypothetical protein